MNASLRTSRVESPRHLPAFGLALLGLATVVLAGCTVGPNYQRPEMAPPPAFDGAQSAEAKAASSQVRDTTADAAEGAEDVAAEDAGAAARDASDISEPVGEPTVYEAGEPEIQWWSLLGDPQLDALVARALEENHDLVIARANVRAARALLGEGRLELYPVGSASAQASRERASEVTVPQGFDATRTFYSVNLDASWELDFFGRVRRSVEALAADAEARVADERAVALTVASEVVRTYLELRGAQYRLRVAERNADNQSETYDLTQALLEGGRGTDLDLARAEAQLQSTLASLSPLETTIAAAIHRLGVLVGQPPGELRAELTVDKDLPELPTRLDIGDPTSLLRRRPDVQAAERGLAAATARIGVATGDLFPRVTLNGSIGFLATDLGNLFEGSRRTHQIGPFLSWPALDLGRVRRRIDAREADTDARLAAYEKTVLLALEETENALVDYVRSRERQARLELAADASTRATELARIRYRYGAESFLAVLDAERRLLEAQDLEAVAATQAAAAFTRLYKALGGGWQTAAPDLISTDPEVAGDPAAPQQSERAASIDG